MKLVKIINDGKLRWCLKKKCPICHRIYYTPRYRKKGHCSLLCSAKSRRVRIKVYCVLCGKKFEVKRFRHNAGKHGVYFCCRKHKDKAQIEGNTHIVWHNFKDGARSSRNRAEKHLEKKCVGCGLKYGPLLLVHHKDGDRKNNKLKNLEWVCLLCHGLRHMRKVNGIWRFNSSYLTPRFLLRKLTNQALRGRGDNGNTAGPQPADAGS